MPSSHSARVMTNMSGGTPAVTNSANGHTGRVRYELRRDQMEDLPFRIERVEVMGEFATREEAKQYMIDSEDERKARDGS